MVYVRIGGRLLGGHIRGGAECDAERRERAAGRGTHGLRHTEVRDHRMLSRQEHIVGLDVPVHDLVRVRVGEGVGDVGENADRLTDGELALAHELGSERFAFYKRHGVIEQITGRPGCEQGDDVGVLERGGQLDLAPEPLGVDPGRHLRRQNFDDHFPRERLLVREEDAAHPAAA